MRLEDLEKELDVLSKGSKINIDPKEDADNKGKTSKNPFGLDLELMGGSRPRSTMPF